MIPQNDLRRLLHDLRDALTPAHAIIKSRARRSLSEPDFAIIEESIDAAFELLRAPVPPKDPLAQMLDDAGFPRLPKKS